ncbi:hypothetical protein K0U83_20270 [bacterium]|nr:hypothetical protein [bacterium]
MVWARSGEHVDIRSPFLCEIVQKTGQYHKLTAVEAVPANAAMVTVNDIPHEIRGRMEAYESGRPADTAVKFQEPRREIDVTALPSVAPTIVEDEAAPEPELFEEAEGDDD